MQFPIIKIVPANQTPSGSFAQLFHTHLPPCPVDDTLSASTMNPSRTAAAQHSRSFHYLDQRNFDNIQHPVYNLDWAHRALKQFGPSKDDWRWYGLIYQPGGHPQFDECLIISENDSIQFSLSTYFHRAISAARLLYDLMANLDYQSCPSFKIRFEDTSTIGTGAQPDLQFYENGGTKFITLEGKTFHASLFEGKPIFTRIFKWSRLGGTDPTYIDNTSGVAVSNPWDRRTDDQAFQFGGLEAWKNKAQRLLFQV